MSRIAEAQRLEEEARRACNWKRWGPYLSERQWGTVREDYSADGDAWAHFPFDHAHLRAYRWGEDGLLGLSDRECRLCFCPALWNGKDTLLKERLFGLSNTEGNHGEDCKELYYYLDATPTYSYAKALYKYPQAAFPYDALRRENARRGRDEPEYELLDTGGFEDGRYFDLVVEYAKAGPNDLLIRLTATNRGPDTATLDILPKLWFRNTWIWGCQHEGCTLKPSMRPGGTGLIQLEHSSLGEMSFRYEGEPEIGFAENETNTEALYQTPSYTRHTKDSFGRWIVGGDNAAVSKTRGTMAMLRYRATIAAGASQAIRLRLSADSEAPAGDAFADFDNVMAKRIRESDAFWKSVAEARPHVRDPLTTETEAVRRQACAGLLWSKQFYHYSVQDWLRGDPDVAEPPPQRKQGRNAGWPHLFNRDLISMPDKWEYPWYAAWDVAFHMIPFAAFDPHFAKQQLLLFLREWYMHPNGQLPAYEWALGDVNPPTHAWACWQVYRSEAERGRPDPDFLKRAFNKLLLNFTWWVNRKDPDGNNIFGGGFLGLDNIGLFDRSQPLPGGAKLRQADGTAWMAFYSTTMLAMALELAKTDPTYEDIASKFFEHYMAIADAINQFGEHGLWDEETGFYYDEIQSPHHEPIRLEVRSLIGLIPMIAVHSIERAQLEQLPGFRKRMEWYIAHRQDITAATSCHLTRGNGKGALLLALPSEDKLRRLLGYLFDEEEFLSPFGIRSLSRRHRDKPFALRLNGDCHEIRYCPGDSDTALFGGNSNWRGPIWFPLNFLLLQALRQYAAYYGADFTVEYPTGSGSSHTLDHCADDIERRLVALFVPDERGILPYQSQTPQLAQDAGFAGLHQFFEFFNAETGQGHGAAHQTGWTALIASLL